MNTVLAIIKPDKETIHLTVSLQNSIIRQTDSRAQENKRAGYEHTNPGGSLRMHYKGSSRALMGGQALGGSRLEAGSPSHQITPLNLQFT